MNSAQRMVLFGCVFALMLGGCPGNEDTPFRANNGADVGTGDAASDAVATLDTAVPSDAALTDAGAVDAPTSSGYRGVIAVAEIETIRDNLAPDPSETDVPTLAGATDIAPTGFLRARVRTDFATAWNAMINPQTFRDPRSVTRIAVLQYDAQPAFPVSFRTRHYIGGQLIEVTFEITTVAARTEYPEGRVAIMRWQKTAGTSAVSRLEASATLRENPSDGTVELEIVQRLAAPGQNTNTVQDALRVMFERFLATTRGNPPSASDCDPCLAVPDNYLMR